MFSRALSCVISAKVATAGMSETADDYASEIRSGIRFEFGKNWKRFLDSLTDERVELAEKSLSSYLELPRLDGLRFLDVGSGSGLFSLAARRLGATVVSFDYDPHSVGCTAELRRRYFPDDPRWTVMRGSVLDPEFLSGLGPADVVYSWGVLHHTGAMHTAFENIKSLVPVGGRLFIAIYNDLGEVTDRWWRKKQRYNSLPRPLRLAFALGIIGASEARTLSAHLRRRELRTYIRTWTQYQHHSVRGMSRWHDWIDWIGGFPYERAGIEEVVDAFANSGFRLTKLVDRSSGYGCNEFVFRREAAEGNWIDQAIPNSRLLSRRLGITLTKTSTEPGGGLRGRVGSHLSSSPDEHWFVLQKQRLLGEIEAPAADGVVHLPPEIAGRARPDAGPLRLVPGVIEPVSGPFAPQQNRMWAISAPHLSAIADDASGSGANESSPVFVFEDDTQLPLPHSLHDDIRQTGAGRFSHWGEAVYFSTLDGSDPNGNGRRYSLFIGRSAVPPLG